MSIAPAQKQSESAAGWPWTTIDATTTCPNCQGEGRVEIDIPGGRWSTWQGGMYVPDSRAEVCPDCHAGIVDVERCERCHKLSPDSLPHLHWGEFPKDDQCQCDEDTMTAFHEARS